MKFTNFGGVIIASAIDEFTLTPHGAAAAIPPLEVFNAVGMAQCDSWPDGHTARHKIDGVPVMVRRSGWRIELWGVDDPEPAVDALPPPPQATNERPRSSRVEIAEGYLEPALRVPGFDLRGNGEARVSPAEARPDVAAPPTVLDAAGALWRSLGRATAVALRRAERALLERLGRL